MSFYIDTSCLLKLLFPEPESARTRVLVTTAERVVISSLARLETVIRIQGRYADKMISKSESTKLLQMFELVSESAPFDFRPRPAGLVADAERQIRPITNTAYCRTLDRLHLATITAFGLRRLLTNDTAQARADEALGIEVIFPR